MDTSPGGEERNQYETARTENVPHKKSGGQMGQVSSTENPSNTAEGGERKAERGEQTAENIRYGQTISEGGMGGMTAQQGGEAGKEGFGRLQEGSAGMEESAKGERVKAGYGGERDMNREVGA